MLSHFSKTGKNHSLLLVEDWIVTKSLASFFGFEGF
jgi:hypothetical protein